MRTYGPLLTTIFGLSLVIGGCSSADDSEDTGGEATASTTGGMETGGMETGGMETGGMETGGTETGGDGDGDGDGEGACGPDPGYGNLAPGAPAKHIIGVDAEGMPFDSSEWCGIPSVIDLTAEWCGPCVGVSECLGGNDGSCDGTGIGAAVGGGLRNLLETESAGWVTVMVQDLNTWSSNPTLATSWENAFPSLAHTVVVEDPSALYDALAPLGVFPTIHTVDEDMNYLILEDGATWTNLVEFVNTYGG